MIDLSAIEQRVTRLDALADVAKQNHANAVIRLKTCQEFADVVKESVDVVRTVAQRTQMEFERKITTMTDSALETVFQGKYKFKIEFTARRNNSEAVVKLVDANGNEVEPMDDNGGTIVNIISFAMKLTMWRLANPRRRNVIILDEPMKFVSKDLVPLVADMMAFLSHKLDLQIIMVTHIEDLIQRADNIIKVE